jgi:hypothetical protein
MCTVSSRKVALGGVSMWLSPEDSHHWSVENPKSLFYWNVGSKQRLGKARWFY